MIRMFQGLAPGRGVETEVAADDAGLGSGQPSVGGPDSDEALLRVYAQTGSGDAFAQIASRHAGWVYHTCRRNLRDSHLAEDATQAVFLLLARKASSLKSETHLAGWLFRACRYVLADVRKHQARYERRQALARDAALYRLGSCGAAEPSGDPDLSVAVDEAMARLRDSDRQAILMHFYEGLTFRQMAAQMGMTKDAAKKRVARAVARLRSRLNGKLGGSASAAAIGVPLAGLLLLLKAQSAAAAPAAVAAAAAQAATLPGFSSVVAQLIAEGVRQATIRATGKLLAALGATASRGVILVVASLPLADSRSVQTPSPTVATTAASSNASLSASDRADRVSLAGAQLAPRTWLSGQALVAPRREVLESRRTVGPGWPTPSESTGARQAQPLNVPEMSPGYAQAPLGLRLPETARPAVRSGFAAAPLASSSVRRRSVVELREAEHDSTRPEAESAQQPRGPQRPEESGVRPHSAWADAGPKPPPPMPEPSRIADRWEPGDEGQWAWSLGAGMPRPGLHDEPLEMPRIGDRDDAPRHHIEVLLAAAGGSGAPGEPPERMEGGVAMHAFAPEWPAPGPSILALWESGRPPADKYLVGPDIEGRFDPGMQPGKRVEPFGRAEFLVGAPHLGWPPLRSAAETAALPEPALAWPVLLLTMALGRRRARQA